MLLFLYFLGYNQKNQFSGQHRCMIFMLDEQNHPAFHGCFPFHTSDARFPPLVTSRDESLGARDDVLASAILFQNPLVGCI